MSALTMAKKKKKNKPRKVVDFMELVRVNSVKKQKYKDRKGSCSVPTKLQSSFHLLNLTNELNLSSSSNISQVGKWSLTVKENTSLSHTVFYS